jgi:hypothetical protein
MSCHVSNAFASEVSASFRSAGRSWTTPPEISSALRASLIMYRQRYAIVGMEEFEPSEHPLLNFF